MAVFKREDEGARFTAGTEKDVPSDVMTNDKLYKRAVQVSHGSKKRRKPRGFSYRDAGDALAAGKM
jgi:hypothetical protein